MSARINQIYDDGGVVLHILGRLSYSSTHVSQLVTVNDPSISISQLGQHMSDHAEDTF